MNLVTGATGHIGNVLTRELLARGERVRALVLPGEDNSPLEGLDVEMAVGDVLDLDSMHRACSGVCYVFHLAGVISILPGRDETVERVNVDGTRNVLQATSQAGVRRLVYTSSIHALRRVPHGVIIDENIPYDPQQAISAYDQSKAQASLEVVHAAGQGLDAVVACPTGVIGPFDFRLSEMGQLINDAMQDKRQLCVSGTYDFVDVRDVARGLILARDKGRRGESYILSGERLDLEWLIQAVQRLAGVRPVLFNLPMWLARLTACFTPLYYRLAQRKPRLTPYALETVKSNCVISCARARKELGYSSRELCETLADTVKWFQTRQFRSAAKSNLPASL